MGGNAFKTLETPRLTLQEYEKLRIEMLERLEPLFEAVQTPIPDPDKETFGDIDFLVHTPQPGLDTDAVKTALGAQDVLVGKPTSNYAVPFNDAFAQIDVHICPREEHAKQVFLNSYGRLGHILTQALRRHGLYLDVRGLYTVKPRPNVPSFQMTIDLSTVLKLVGLDEERYEAGFKRRQEVWEWIESGNVNGIPLAHSWGPPPDKPEKDTILREWNERRKDDPVVDINKRFNREWALEQLGLVDSHARWAEELEAERKRAELEKARADAITEEIRTRLARLDVRGKALKEEARRLRAEVEAEYAAKDFVKSELK